MRILKNLFTILFTSYLLVSFSKKETYSLTIQTEGLRNSEGKVIFLLYNKEGSIPDKKQTKYYKKKTNTIQSTSSSITFENLPKGNYAINIIHDENDNGKIDKGFLLPKEGIGFSNFQRINLANRPSFSKAEFELNKDSVIQVKTIYM